VRRVRAAALLVALALGACGGDDDDDGEAASASAPPSASASASTAAEVAADGAPCDVAQAVADLDDEFQGELNDVLQRVIGAADEQEAQAALDELGPLLAALDLDPLLDAYATLERELDGEEAAAAGALRTFTEELVEELRTAGSAEEMTDLLADLGTDEDAVAAGQAALTLDAWSRETCDVVIAD